MPIFRVIIEDFQTIIGRCEIECAGGINIFLLELLHLRHAMILNLLLLVSVVLGSSAVRGEDNPFLFGRALLIWHSL